MASLSGAQKAAATYDAAADSYDHPANTFWARFGKRTIDRVGLRPGDRVLDVCCGSGASAIPAAEAVGPAGWVIGIDLAENLLALARAKATSRGLRNIEFRNGDMMNLQVPVAHFDAVVCVFGIFFVEDMAAAARSLWKAVRPGGKLAVTTWGPQFLEPANTAFWDAIREVRPELYKEFRPWDRINEPTSLRAVLREGGIDNAEVTAEAGEHQIASPEDWWSAVLGTGYRGTFEHLDASQREHVRNSNFAYIQNSGVRFVQTNVVCAIATKP